MSFDRKTLATLLVALVIGSTMAGFGIYLLNYPAVQSSEHGAVHGGFEDLAVAYNSNSGSTSINALTCHNTISVAANSVLVVASTQYTNSALTFAVHGQTMTSLKTSTSSSTYPYAQIDGTVIGAAATVTYYVNFTSAKYWDCFAADFTQTTLNSTFTGGSGAMTNANTTAISCSVTPTVSGEAIFGVWGDKTTQTTSITYSLTSSPVETELVSENTTTDIDHGEDAYYLSSSTSAYAMTATASTAKDSGGACVGLLPSVVPSTPTALIATAATTTTIPLSWTVGASQLSRLTAGEVYQASYSGGCGSYTPSYAASSPYTSYTVTGLTIATEYCFQVTVSNRTWCVGA